MAKYDNIDVNEKNAFEQTPSYEDIMKQKGKDVKKALHKQKKEDDAEARGKAMDEEIAKEAEAKKEVEKQAIENNGSTVETRDKNKALETQEPAATAVEDIKTQVTEPETENAEEFQIDTKANINKEPISEETDTLDKGTLQDANVFVELPGISDAAKEVIKGTDEYRHILQGIQNSDSSVFYDVVDPNGQPALKGHVNEDGEYVPYVYTKENSRLVKGKGWAAALTILSFGLSAFGSLIGVPVMPINFFDLGANSEADLERLNKLEQDHAAIANAGLKEANETIRTREATQESNLSDIDAYKDLADEDVQKTAQVNAAVAGQNAQLDVQRAAQEWEAKQKELDRDFQKEMNNLNTDSQIEILKQQGVNQKDLATLMNDLDAQRIMKKIAYAKEAGLTPDETAKWLRAEQGITQFGAAMGYMGDATKVAGQVAGALMTGGASDKDCKKFVYDGKSANSKMFSKLRPKW